MKIDNRSADVFLTETLSLLQPLLVLLHEFLSETLEAWERFNNELSVSLLQETSWVGDNVSVDTSPEEIAHVDFGAVTDHPLAFSEMFIDLIKGIWHNLSVKDGVLLGLIISKRSSPFESVVDDWLIHVGDVIIPVGLDWVSWIQTVVSGDVPSTRLGLVHECTILTLADWKTTKLFLYVAVVREDSDGLYLEWNTLVVHHEFQCGFSTPKFFEVEDLADGSL